MPCTFTHSQVLEQSDSLKGAFIAAPCANTETFPVANADARMRYTFGG